MNHNGVSVTNITTWWNQIASWTSSCILYEATYKNKLSMVKLFLLVVEKLIELRNYSTCAQIISGINHHSVSRLHGLKEVSLHNSLLLFNAQIVQHAV